MSIEDVKATIPLKRPMKAKALFKFTITTKFLIWRPPHPCRHAEFKCGWMAFSRVLQVLYKIKIPVCRLELAKSLCKSSPTAPTDLSNF